MLFNSFEFLFFFVVTYSLYLCLKTRLQNRLLLVASYIFYAAWDWRFLSLLLISTLVDFFCGQAIVATANQSQKKKWLFISLVVNLSILGFFKYFNFFIDSFYSLINNFFFLPQKSSLNIILPVGISFYTFQTLSYTIDIYYGRIKPTKDMLNFALFVSFFPQLVAGPIERAKNLLPQIESPRKISLSKFYEGCYLIFWGLFLKVVIADNLAVLVDPVFAVPGPQKGIVVLGAIYAFAFQIFCDFAGYSNIARGLCKCMGFEIMVNFNLPYFATNPSDFWKRWHISLSTWLRDYLYIPLGGNRKRTLRTYFNLCTTMLLGGLWHGAAWTYVLWGAYQGILLIIYRSLNPVFSKLTYAVPQYFKKIWFGFKTIFFFHLICLGWLIFRAQNIRQIKQMLTDLLWGWEGVTLWAMARVFKEMMPFIGLLLVVQSYQFFKNDLMAVYKAPSVVKGFFYFISLILFIIFGVSGAKEFIYFQF